MIETETLSPNFRDKKYHKRNISNSKNEVEEFSTLIKNNFNSGSDSHEKNNNNS